MFDGRRLQRMKKENLSAGRTLRANCLTYLNISGLAGCSNDRLGRVSAIFLFKLNVMLRHRGQADF